ncbi:HNH endonuclease [Escherichia coli]|uniref:HNH endonuclease signature motif containing protein n=1 Tax=Escherichia coli TaxID=562 RepID=UPI003F90532C
MARYFTREIDSKWFAKIDDEDTFVREYKHKAWRYWGKTSHFIVAVKRGYWKEITAAEAGDIQYAYCSQCAENWHELFDYHHDGYLISKVARGSVKPGDIIRGSKWTDSSGHGHFQIRVKGRLYQLTRVVWEMFNGPIPANHVIENADNSCVKIENLKLISCCERNTRYNVIGKSGIRGIYWNKKNNKWIANVGYDYLGCFDNINDAINACINGEIERYGKQINDFPDYISPEEAERIKQRYYEGEEMKQIEINTESHEHEQELPRAFKYHGHDVRVNEADEINLIDIAAAMGVVNEDDLRHRIDSLNKLPGYIYCTEQYDMQIDKGYAPFEIAGMVAARIGAEKDRIDLSLAFHKFKNDRICAAIARKTAGEQVDSKKVESLKAELAALKADKAKADNASAEKTERDANAVASAQQKVDKLEDQIEELQKQFDEMAAEKQELEDQAVHWFGEYEEKKKALFNKNKECNKLKKENDNLLDANCELRQRINAANDENAKAKARAAADEQTLRDVLAQAGEANKVLREANKVLRQEVDAKNLAFKGYQLKLAELEDDKNHLQHAVNLYQSCYKEVYEKYNKLADRNLQRRAAQKRYMSDLHQEHVTEVFECTQAYVTEKMEWMQAMEAAGDWHKRHQQRQQQRYRKLVRALQQRVKDLLYRLDKKPEGGFFSKVKGLFNH